MDIWQTALRDLRRKMDNQATQIKKKLDDMLHSGKARHQMDRGFVPGLSITREEGHPPAE